MTHSHSTDHTHDHAATPGDNEHIDWATVVMDETFWNDLYSQSPSRWSGNPNPQLVAEVTGLTVGTALDVGCGEGADAVWLHEQGWTTTAIDISSVAVERSRAHAGERPITFQQVDLTTEPAPGTFDLVSAQFFHLREPDMTTVLETLGRAVVPGGRLLLVGHHPADELSLSGHKAHRELLRDEKALADFYGTDAWSVEVCEARRRDATLPDGRAIVTTDAVVMLTKKS